MKNTNKSVKAKSKKSTKKVVAKVAKTAPVAQTAPETQTQIQVQVTPVAEVAPVVKRGRGRPRASSSQSVVNLADLIAVLPSNSNVVLPNPFLRSLQNLGFKINAKPFRANPVAIGEIAKTYKPVANINVTDLNEIKA